MKFIHAGDIHLGNSLNGLSFQQSDKQFKWLSNSLFKSFDNLVNLAINEQVDFLVLPGDIYDGIHRSYLVEDTLNKGFGKLESVGIDVYIIRGNHDFTSTESSQLNFPANVFFLENENTIQTFTTINNEKIEIVGQSYNQQHEKTSLISDYPKRNPDADFVIGLYHGDVSATSTNYAAVSLNQLTALNYDYIALGHIHTHQILNEKPAVAYSGSLQGLNSKETGPHGVYLVDSDKNFIPEFKQTADLEWAELKIQINSNSDLSSIINQITNKLQNQKVYVLILSDENVFNTELAQRIENGILKDQINQSITENIFISKIKIDTEDESDIKSLPELDQEIWKEAIEETFNFDETIKQIQSRFNQVDEQFITDYFSQSEIQSEIKKRAIQLLNMNGGDLNEDN
jgi:DNA repair exonuclease SbcCD nuclease subunit